MKKNTLLLLKDSFLCTFFSFVLIFLLSLLFINISFFKPLTKAMKDFSFLDIYYSENFNPSYTVNNDIIIINIEKKNRLEISNLLNILKSEVPKVIGIDVIFKEKKISLRDSLLADALQTSNIVMPYLIKNDSILKSNSVFNNSNKHGFINLSFDDETNVTRKFSSIKKHKDTLLYSFSYQIAKSFLGSNWMNYKLNKRLSKDNEIKYHGNYTSFLTFGFNEFMQLANKSFIRNKIILLGYVGTPTGNIYDIEDKKFTPLNKVTAGKSTPDMFGVIIHANIINMLIKNEFMYTISNFWIAIIIFCSSFFVIMYLIWLGEKNTIYYMTVKKIVLFMFSVILMWITLWLFKKGIILKTTPIIAITIASASFIPYYIFLIKYLKTKTEWNSYIK